VARAEATRIAVPVTGTLGILVKAVRRGVCDLEAAERYLEKMIEAGFFSPVRSVREIA
jgi:predicted nucleic acid-binding protein